MVPDEMNSDHSDVVDGKEVKMSVEEGYASVLSISLSSADRSWSRNLFVTIFHDFWQFISSLEDSVSLKLYISMTLVRCHPL